MSELYIGDYRSDRTTQLPPPPFSFFPLLLPALEEEAMGFTPGLACGGVGVTGCGGSPAARGPNTSEALAGLAVLTQDDMLGFTGSGGVDRATGGA